MSAFAELVFEIVFSFTLEFSVDILVSKRVRLWIKIPVFILFLLTVMILPAIFISVAVHQYSIDNLILTTLFFGLTLICCYLVYKLIKKKQLETK